MRITRFWAINFRGLWDIKLHETQAVNVIVGPNAVGKSTFLEAIRLSKSILSPRFPNEAQQSLATIGVLSPQFQAVGSNVIDFAAIANDATKEVRIGFTVELGDDDLGIVRSATEQISITILQNQLANSGNRGTFALTQFLSSPIGINSLNSVRNEVKERVKKLTPSSTLILDLRIHPTSWQMSGAEFFDQSILMTLDGLLPPNKSVFSFFPADRILPQGEQPMQLGTADVQQQLLSHLAAPSSKYSRIKQTIVQKVIAGTDGIEAITEEVNAILSGLLPGKRLAGIRISPIGALKIMIEDKISGKVFDIDAMSSGEKGVLMTFLFIRLSMARGGIVLLDEPELHLNATVQEKLMKFLYEHCVEPMSLQVFLCTHSPEIVREAIGKPYCGLFHLRNGSDLTPVYERDQREIFEIFERLGHSPSEVLFTKGDIYVEGEHDDIILRSGFDDILTEFKISSLGGRDVVEREMPLLQQQERKGHLKKLQLFIIDNDGIPTELRSSSLVKIIQWSRRNIENYLIDDNILFDLISANATRDIESRGRFPDILAEVACGQIKDASIRGTCGAMLPQSLGVDNKVLRDSDVVRIAEVLSAKVAALKKSLEEFDEANWKKEFVEQSEARSKGIQLDWRLTWREKCDGKKLIDDLYRIYEVRLKKIEFKKQVMSHMRRVETDNWREIKGRLTEAVT